MFHLPLPLPLLPLSLSLSPPLLLLWGAVLEELPGDLQLSAMELLLSSKAGGTVSPLVFHFLSSLQSCSNRLQTHLESVPFFLPVKQLGSVM